MTLINPSTITTCLLTIQPAYFKSLIKCLLLKLFDNLRNNNILVLPLNRSSIVQLFLYGSEDYDQTVNNFIISCIIDFIIQSRRFDDPLIN